MGRDEKLLDDIKRELAKISALSSGKIDKDEYLKGKEILTPDQRRVIEQTKFIYSSLGKGFEKQIKTVEDQGEKQIKALVERPEYLIKSSGQKESLTLLNTCNTAIHF